MLPLVALKVCDTGADADAPSDVPPDLFANIVKQAREAAERRKSSLDENGDFKLPPSKQAQARDEANNEVLKQVAERNARVADDVARQAAEEAEQARQREERAADLAAAQLELRRAEESLKTNPRLDTDDGSSDESDVVSIGPDTDDEGAADDMEALFAAMEDEEGASEAQQSSVVDLADQVNQLDSIYAHMEEALSEINKVMESINTRNNNLHLFEIATRIKADMRLISMIRATLLGVRHATIRRPNGRGRLVVSPGLREDMQHVSQLVREAVAEQQADDPGGAPDATVSRWNDRVLPIIGMLLFLLSTYYYMFPRTSDEVPVVRNEGFLPLLNLPDLADVVPNTSPVDFRTYKYRFHKAVHSARSSSRACQHHSRP
jgi:hypothetical protein